MKIKFLFILVCIIGLITTILSSHTIAPLLLGGKTLEGRSLLIKVLYFIPMTLIFSVSYYFLLKSFWLLFFCNKKVIKIREAIVSSTIHIIDQINKYYWLKWLIIIIILIVSISYFLIHLKIVLFPFPLEMRESTQQLTTHAFINGINPYTIENNPTYINVYGFFYNLLISPFAKWFGNTLVLHRFFNAIFILCQMILLYVVLKKQKIDRLLALASLLFIWLGQLFYVTPLARPDTLGELLFLFSLLIPFIYHFNTPSLVFSIFIGIISFYTKIYFIFGLMVLAGYLFLFISKRKALFFVVGTGILFLISAILINHTFETYFVNIINIYFAQPTAYSYEDAIKQSIKYLRDYWGLFLIGFIAVINLVGKKTSKKKISSLFNLSNLNEPLLSIRMDFSLFCLIGCSLFVLFVLGTNTGTYMTNYYQLISPFFLLVVCGWIGRLKWSTNFVLLLFIATLISQSYENLKPDLLTFSNPDWAVLNERIRMSKKILNSPLDISFLLEQNKPITTSGLTQYYFYYPSNPFPFYANINAMKARGEQYIDNIHHNISTKEYDFLETFQVQGTSRFTIGKRLDSTLSDEQFISQYYHLTQTLTFIMPHTYQSWDIGIWEPN